MSNDKILSIIIQAKDQAGGVFAKLSAEVDATSTKLAKVGETMVNTGRKLDNVGSDLTKTFTLPIVALGTASTKMAMDFQQSMTYVRTDAGDTQDDIDQLSQSVLDLAKKSQFSPDELANGLYHLASLGLRGADAINALNTAQQMASVGGANLEDTSTALGAALVTGIKGVQNYGEAAGTMDAIIGAGNMRMEDLVQALGTGVLPAFKGAGLSLTEFGAALATLTDNGMNASEASTRLRMSISMMQAPSGPASDALAALGMTANQVGMDMQTKGLIPALQDLKTHLISTYGTTAEGKQKIAQALAEMFGGGRSSAAIETLLDQLDRVSSKEGQISSQSGEFANKVAEQQQTAAAKMKVAWSGIQADLITLGGELLPRVAGAATTLANDVDKLIKRWDELSPVEKKIVEDLALFLAVSGPVLSTIGKMSTGIGAVVKVGGGLTGLFTKLLSGTVITGEAGAAVGAMGAEAGAATGMLGGLAAILTGPVGLAIIGTVLVAGGAYLAYKHFAEQGVQPVIQKTDELHELAKKYNVTLTTVGTTVGLVELAEKRRSDAQQTVAATQSAVTQANDAYKHSQDTVKQATDDVKAAQDKVTQALDTYGKNSPQYQTASQQLADKQQALYLQELNTWGVTVQQKTADDDLTAAQRILKGTTSDLAGIQNALNGGLASGNKIIADFGPTALAQVPSIVTLQNTISGVVTSFKNMTTTIQGGSALTVSTLQGVGSTINRIQGQSNTLNASLQNASNRSLQGGAVSLQGGGFASGGFTGIGGTNDVAGIVHKGEFVIPRSQVNQQTGQPTLGSTFNLYGNVNLGSADAVDRFFERLNAQQEMASYGVGV